MREAFEKWWRVETETMRTNSTYAEAAWSAWQAATAAAIPADPMDWPLPCDVTVGHGTMRKGVKLRTLVLRMKTLYEMATGENADEVASRTLEQRIEIGEQATAAATPPGYVLVPESEAQDAKRYQWLKEECHEWKPADYDGLPYGRHHLDLLRVDESDLDAAIDTAILQAAKESKT